VKLQRVTFGIDGADATSFLLTLEEIEPDVRL
jgi:hypothetical protein